jgi:hypothetical protein
VSQIAVRRWHRRVGIAIALFVILQAGTGLMLEWENSWLDRSAHEPPHEHEPGLAATIHHGPLGGGSPPCIQLPAGAGGRADLDGAVRGLHVLPDQDRGQEARPMGKMKAA